MSERGTAPEPPRFTRRALAALLPDGPVGEAILGDLHEEYVERSARISRRAAARWYRRQAARVVVGYVVRRWTGLLPATPTEAVAGRVRPRGDRPGAFGVVLDGWRLDLKQAVRSLRARPTSSMTVIATITIAVGALTAIYSVVDGVLLKPLPYPESDRLARIWMTTSDWRNASEAEFRSVENRRGPLAPSYYDWLEAETGFASLGAWVDAAYVLHDDDGARALRGQEATAGLFDALGVEPILGRRLQPADDMLDAPAVVVISESLWRDRFGARPNALGAGLNLGSTPHRVIGVMPRGFQAPATDPWDSMLPAGEPLLWTPLGSEARRGWKNVSVLGRLRPGLALQTASERLAEVQDGATAVYPDYRGAWAERLLDSVVGDVRSTLWFLLGAGVLVLLVATVNIANILTAAALGRRGELAVRAALGAGTSRLVRGRFVEGALMAVLGGVGGILFAWVGLPLLTSALPASLPRNDAVSMSAGVLLFGVAVTAGTALLVGVFPAFLAARADPEGALLGSARGSTSDRASTTFRGALVVVEVSLAFVLLVGAGLLANSFQRLWSVERGFATDGIVAMRVTPDRDTYRTGEDRDRFARELADALDRIAGVRSTLVNNLPLSGSLSRTVLLIERPVGEPDRIEALLTVSLENHLDVLGIPLAQGRGFERGDIPDGNPVAVVSESLARRAWPGDVAVGKHLRTSDDSIASIEVIGVVRDVRHEGLAAEAAPTIYLPLSQSTRVTDEVVLQVRGDIGSAIRSARGTVAALSPSTPIRRVIVLDETIAESVAVPRFRTALVVGLAGIAGVLALLGVYGVVSFAVGQQAREVGVRMALGARTGSVVLRVAGSGVVLGIAGVALGLVLALGVADVLEAFLFEVTPTDPATYVAVSVAVLLVCCVAAFVPARRAATIDPVTVLKAE